jgi:hypothetical protein
VITAEREHQGGALQLDLEVRRVVSDICRRQVTTELSFQMNLLSGKECEFLRTRSSMFEGGGSLLAC